MSTPVIEGAEAFHADGDERGVLVLHGFTGNPVSLRPLAAHLAAQGATVTLPRLPGHGTDWRDLQRHTWHDWAREAAAALEGLRDRTRLCVVVGLSMGGTLALHLAQQRPDAVDGLVLINPSVYSGDPRLRALPLLKWVVSGLPGIGNDIARPGGDEKPYPTVPLRALHSFVQLQRRVRAGLGDVHAPTLVLTSRQDHVVEPHNSRVVLDGITSSETEQVWLERSFHVATLDHDAPLIEARTAAFVDRLASH